jgi:hypothetical protein
MVMACVATGLVLAVLSGVVSAGVPPGRALDEAVRRAGFGMNGLEVGLDVMVEGEGPLASREAGTPRPAASAIKTAIALVLLADRETVLNEQPTGVELLLRAGVHPAFRGFSADELDDARVALVGKTHLDLARVMMGRTGAANDVYNAACNILMIKLGGPRAIETRLHALDPAFRGLRVDHYMLTWNGDGDNRATPRALVALYRDIARGEVPGLDEERAKLLRDLVRESGDGSPGSLYEKPGTLYPRPMARVHAGYVERGAGDLVFAVMGEAEETSDEPPAETFVRLMAAVDSVAAACRRIATAQ